jgi:hypothetical protein
MTYYYYYYYYYYSYFHKLVKIAIKLDRLKSFDDGFKTQSTHFWKYVSNFKRKEYTVVLFH